MNRRRSRRAATILEVLFAILVSTIGLLGAIAIFPVASAQARKARINEAMAAAGRAAVHTFDAMGMRRPDRWIGWNEFWEIPTPPGSPPPVPYTFKLVSSFVYPFPYGTSFCIDPRLVAANAATPALARQASLFPFPSRLVPADPRMFRVTLPSGVGTPPIMTSLHADAIFQLDDDLAYDRPAADRSAAAQQIFDSLFMKRQSDGHFSWIATLVPKLDLYSGGSSDEYVLSIVVFHDRPTNMSLADPLAALNERVVEAHVEDGITGGEVFLHWPAPGGVQNSTNEETARKVLKLRPNDWILLAGVVRGSPPPGIPHFQWYRITHLDSEVTPDPAPRPAFSGLGYGLYATLIGQDWDTARNFNPQIPAAVAAPPTLGTAQAFIIEGVVAVYEKTVRLDTSAF